MPIGALAAYSRVFVGVHYATDAIIDFLLGTSTTTALMLMFAGSITSVVIRLRRHGTIGMLLMSEATRHGSFPDADSVRPISDEIGPRDQCAEMMSGRRRLEHHPRAWPGHSGQHTDRPLSRRPRSPCPAATQSGEEMSPSRMAHRAAWVREES